MVVQGWRDGTSPTSKLLVDVVADGVTEPAHLKIRVKKYVAESRVETDLVKLVTKLQNQILDKLDGGLKPLAYTTPTRFIPLVTKSFISHKMFLDWLGVGTNI